MRKGPFTTAAYRQVQDHLRRHMRSPDTVNLTAKELEYIVQEQRALQVLRQDDAGNWLFMNIPVAIES